VVDTIKRYSDGKTDFTVLDIGACDGKMLSVIKDCFPEAQCFGVEPERVFVEAVSDKRIKVVYGEVENFIFPEESVDFVILSSVLEHIKEPEKILGYAIRLLRRSGKIILLNVVGFYDRLAVLLGVKNDDHIKNYAASELKDMLKVINVLSQKKLLFYYLTVAEKQ